MHITKFNEKKRGHEFVREPRVVVYEGFGGRKGKGEMI